MIKKEPNFLKKKKEVFILPFRVNLIVLELH